MSAIEFETLSVPQAAEQRRSIRTYKPGSIPRSDLLEILRLAGLAPSSMNVQPWRFVVVESPELKEQLAAAAYRQKQVTAAPAVIVLYTDMADTVATLDETFHPGMDAATRERMRAGFLSYVGAMSEPDREVWAAGQGYIALGFLLLVAESHGYQTSAMLGFDPEAVKKLLNLPPNARIPALIAIGKGAEDGFPHFRHPVQRIVRFM